MFKAPNDFLSISDQPTFEKISDVYLNLENQSIETSLDLVPLKSKPINGKAVMSNSFGFGGTNASVIFSAVTEK